MADEEKQVLIPSWNLRMTPQRYVACFKRSLDFHLNLMRVEDVQTMDKGAKKELLDLVCEDVRRLYNISDADNKIYKAAAMKALNLPQKADA